MELNIRQCLTDDDIKYTCELEKKYIKLPRKDQYSVPKSRRIYTKNSNTYIVLETKETKEILGFCNVFPINDAVYEDILSGEKTDAHLDKDDILPQYYNSDRPINAYIASVVIDTDKCKELGVNNALLFLMQKVFNTWKNSMYNQGYVIKRVIADAVTPDGEKLCKLFGLEPAHSSKHKSMIYTLDLLRHKNYLKLSKFEGKAPNAWMQAQTFENIYKRYFHNRKLTTKVKKYFKELGSYLKHLPTIRKNKKLIKKYPFLSYWKSKYDEGHPGKDAAYDEKLDFKFHRYDSTFLDDMPEAWKKAFGIKMCDEIKAELVKYNFLNDYTVVQVKEKYGTLRWYDGGTPKDSKIDDIISKYEDYSMSICIKCGKPSGYMTDGWISYQCADCLKKDGYTDEDLAKCRLTWKDIPKRTRYEGDKAIDIPTEIDFKSIWPEK